MKKLYTTLLAASTLFAASAALPEATTATLTAEPAAKTNQLTKINLKPLRAADFKLSETATPSIRPTGIDIPDDDETYTWVSLGQGKYIASVMADVYGASTEPTDVEIFEAKEKAGLYKAVGVWADIFESNTQELIVDASDPTFIKVTRQFTGLTDNTDGATWIASYTSIFTDEQGYEPSIVQAAIESGNIPNILPTLANNVITFPEGALALQWPNAPADSKYGTDPNAWYMSESAGALVLPGGEYVAPWTLLGEGTFSGDIFFKTFGKTPADYKVQVFQSSSDENIYRVNDALKGLYTALGFKGESPKWELDATVADNVSLPITSTNINGGDEDGVYYSLSMNQNVEESIEECPEENRIKLTKESNTLTFDFPAKSLLLYASTSQSLYIGNKEAAKLTVELPDNSGIGSIEAVDNNAPVEYFNLQGQRVANPTAGQLMIKRQGTKVTKVVVK